VDNVSLRCRCHNLLTAEDDFGREAMGRARERRAHESLARQAACARLNEAGRAAAVRKTETVVESAASLRVLFGDRESERVFRIWAELRRVMGGTWLAAILRRRVWGMATPEPRDLFRREVRASADTWPSR
jgi:hypothetical protein